MLKMRTMRMAMVKGRMTHDVIISGRSSAVVDPPSSTVIVYAQPLDAMRQSTLTRKP